MSEVDAALTAGYCMAAAQVKREYDQPGIAASLLKSVGVTSLNALRSVTLEEFDAEILRCVIRSEFGRAAC